MNSIRVSICTSVLNQSEMLKEMIASVVAQTFPDWELLIVDDGSTEDIKAVVDSFDDKRIRFFRFDENKGIPHGSNFAMQIAIGEYIGLLAADEVIATKKLEEQIAYLDEHKGVDCIWGVPGRGALGPVPLWEQNALRAHNRSREAWLRTLLNREGVPIGGASFLMRRDVMKSLGYLDPKLTIFSDHELYCRFFEKHVGVILPYRWAKDRELTLETGPQSVRGRNQATAEEELAYVLAKHPMIIPPTTGKVTVGIACYNMAKFLPDAVNSILAQTHQVDEILILDDGSTDDFKTVAQQFTDPRIKLMAFPENLGMQEAMNQLAFRAEGEFYVSLAADDKMHQTFVEKCLSEYVKNPWLEFVATQTDFYLEDWTPYTVEKNPFFQTMLKIPRAENHTREEWLSILYHGNVYFGAGMYRTRVISDVGGWDKQMKVISDWEMYLKLLQRENIHIIEEDLTHTRLHGGNTSITQFTDERMKELPKLYHEGKKRYYRQLMKVVIATPFYELKGFSPYITSMVETIRLLTACGIDWRFMELSGDSYVHRARNTMCDQFLNDPDATDLFFIDSDQSWNPDAFVKMLVLPDDVVGGSYPVKNNWEGWTSIPEMHEENGKQHYKGRELGDGTALIEAHVLAGGFLRIKRNVLERFRDHYKDLWYVEPSTDKANPERKYTAFFAAESSDHKFFGEDHMFSKRLRDMGIRMFIYPNATITHFGIKGWTGNLDTYLKEQKKIGLEQPQAQPQAA